MIFSLRVGECIMNRARKSVMLMLADSKISMRTGVYETFNISDDHKNEWFVSSLNSFCTVSRAAVLFSSLGGE